MDKPKCWNGTVIPKSLDNVFNWRVAGAPKQSIGASLKRSENSTKNSSKRAGSSGKEFIIYSKAKASK